VGSKGKPSLAQRVRGSVLVAPSRLGLFVEPYVGAATDEDAFSGGEGGQWVWYPLAGSLRPRPLERWWHVAGPGAGAVGNLRVQDGRARFVPTRFWRRRGIVDWEREVRGDRRDGTWVVLAFDDGEAVLRRRRGAAP
jgi:hypothetical protein